MELKIRMGVIGMGGIAEGHIRGILQSNDAELVAICDVDPYTLQQKGEQHSIAKRFTDYRELLKCSEIDAVSICTPNHMHYPIAREAIMNKKPFALEKPVSLNEQEAQELKRLADEHGVTNMVCFSYRFKGAARYAKWLIDQGHLGDIYHVYGQYLFYTSIVGNKPLLWRFRKELAGSGALGDLGSHMLDLTRFLVGDFQSVCSHTGTNISARKMLDSEEMGEVTVDDYCHFLAKLDNGVSANYSITRCAFGRFNYQRFEIYGSKGGLVYHLDESDTLEVCLGDVYGQSRMYQKMSIPPHFQANQMQAFFDLINGKGDGLAATLEDGVMNQRLLDTILHSAEEHKWMDLKGELG
jgi:predicted dehydrogenase